MKVLLINGSPHKEGCTYTALSEVAAQLQKHEIETEIFWIGNQHPRVYRLQILLGQGPLCFRR